MKVFRPINNNIVSAVDENGAEIIAIGTGIGYKARPGDMIPADKIKKIYRMDDQDINNRIKDSLLSIPGEYIEIACDILEYAQNTLKQNLYERTFITLANHICFAVQRHNDGMVFENALLDSVRQFYAPEYEIGIHALDMIEQRLGIRFVVDEAASIAMYILNAEYDISVRDTFEATTLIKEILTIIERETGCTLSQEQDYSECFLAFLKYLVMCAINKETASENDDKLYSLLQNELADEMRCVSMIAAHIGNQCGYIMPGDEMSNLALHIHKLCASRPGSEPAKDIIIASPVDGVIVPISQVNDPVFSEDILGRGIAIKPRSENVTAPADAKISLMLSSGHAVNLLTDDGVELLVHIGIDTVKLKGRHYTICKNKDDYVRTGDVLIEFDGAAIIEEGFDTAISVVVCNPDDFSKIAFSAEGPVKTGQPLITIQR